MTECSLYYAILITCESRSMEVRQLHGHMAAFTSEAARDEFCIRKFQERVGGQGAYHYCPADGDYERDYASIAKKFDMIAAARKNGWAVTEGAPIPPVQS